MHDYSSSLKNCSESIVLSNSAIDCSSFCLFKDFAICKFSSILILEFKSSLKSSISCFIPRVSAGFFSKTRFVCCYYYNWVISNLMLWISCVKRVLRPFSSVYISFFIWFSNFCIELYYSFSAISISLRVCCLVRVFERWMLVLISSLKPSSKLVICFVSVAFFTLSLSVLRFWLVYFW